MATYDLRFIHGSTHLVVGPSGSGKTFRTARILELKDYIITNGEKIKNVVFCYSTWQPIYSELQAVGLVTKWVNKCPSNEEFKEITSPYTTDGGSIVIIDDFMGEISKDLVDIVCVSSRHTNTTTFILFQSLFPPNPLARQISLNCKYLHIHKNPRENAQIGTFARQAYPDGWRWLVQAYHEITKLPHSCMLVDLTQKIPEELRVRSNILPEEFPMIIWREKGRAI